MTVPKRKRSRARRDKRFANKGLAVRMFTTCANCTEIILPHQACKACGHYKGRQVISTKTERLVKSTDVRTEIAGKVAKRAGSSEVIDASAQNA